MRRSAVFIVLTACDSGRRPATAPDRPSPRDAVLAADASLLDAAAPDAPDARDAPDVPIKRRGHGLEGFDLDGDGTADQIDASFSGGGHCCYSLAVTPSKTKTRVAFPFEIDGHYVGGIDLSIPNQLNIRDYDGDGIAEICAEIQMYNGEKSPIPAAWKKRYRIKTNVIEIRFATGAAVVRDHTGSCE